MRDEIKRERIMCLRGRVESDCRLGCCLPLRRRQIVIHQMQITYLALKQCRKRCSPFCKMTFSVQYRWCLLHGLSKQLERSEKTLRLTSFPTTTKHSICSYLQRISWTLPFAVDNVLDYENHGVYHTFFILFLIKDLERWRTRARGGSNYNWNRS